MLARCLHSPLLVLGFRFPLHSQPPLTIFHDFFFHEMFRNKKKQVFVQIWLSDLFCKPQKTRTFQMIFPSSRLCKSPCQRSTTAFHYPSSCTPHGPLSRLSMFKLKEYLQTRWMTPLQEQWWLLVFRLQCDPRQLGLFAQFRCLLQKIRKSEHSFDKILPQSIVWRTLRFSCSMLFQSSFC